MCLHSQFVGWGRWILSTHFRWLEQEIWWEAINHFTNSHGSAVAHYSGISDALVVFIPVIEQQNSGVIMYNRICVCGFVCYNLDS